MTHADRDREWRDQFLAVEPGSNEWRKSLAELGRRMERLDIEDQVKVAERLGGQRGEAETPEVIVQLLELESLSLPARIILEKARGEAGSAGQDESLVGRLEQWLNLCEAETGGCDPRGFFSMPDPAQRSVANHLTQWLRADLLEKLIEAAPDKAAGKELRKALHHVRSAGARVSDESGRLMTVAPREEPEPFDEAYLTPPDDTGTYLTYLYRTVFGSAKLFMVFVNDLHGVLKMEAYEIPRPRLERILEATRKNPHAVLAKAEPEFVRRLIKQAEAAGRKRGEYQHPDYLANRRAMGVATAGEGPHPLWRFLREDELRTELGLVARSHELVQHRIFEDWRLRPVEEGKFAAELADLQHPLLELSPEQAAERERLFFEKAATLALAATGREIWRDRLLACAYLLCLIGDQETARMAAAAGLALDRADDPAGPFWVELLRRTTDEYMKKDDQAGDAGGKPGPDRGGLVVL